MIDKCHVGGSDRWKCIRLNMFVVLLVTVERGVRGRVDVMRKKMMRFKRQGFGVEIVIVILGADHYISR